MVSRRARIVMALPVVAVVGLAARFGLPGALGDALGGIAYTALVYGLIAAALPHLPVRTVAVAAFAWSAAMEALQATGTAADLVDLWSPLRLVVGTSFVATDLIAYAAGAALAAAADARSADRARKTSRSG